MNELMTYDEFERDWLRKHRGSIPRKRRVSSLRGVFWVVFWLVVALGAAVYSAAHTIPAAELTILRDVPNRSELALSVFTIVELLIFGAAAKRRDISWLVYVMAGAVLVALVSNVGSSVLAVNENGGNLLNQFSGVLLSILAPMTALAAGEVLHIEQRNREKAKREADDEFAEATKEMNAKINTGWKRYVKERDGELPDAGGISPDFTKFHEKSVSPNKRVKLHEIAREIHENGDGGLSTADMIEKYRISLGSTTKVREMLKGMNGNGGG